MSEAREAKCSPFPCAISWVKFSKFSKANIVVFWSAMTCPSFVQPDVPELMPKVPLPNVPLVVAIMTCGAIFF